MRPRRTRHYVRGFFRGHEGHWSAYGYRVPVPRWWELWRWPVFAWCCALLRLRGYSRTMHRPLEIDPKEKP